MTKHISEILKPFMNNLKTKYEKHNPDSTRNSSDSNDNLQHKGNVKLDTRKS